MTRASPAQVEKARRLLAYEGAAGSADECAAAAARVCDKLHAHLDPLLGAAGVQALLARSAKLTRAEHPCLDVSFVDGSTALRERLRAEDPAAATEAAAALFGTFFTLINTFIGERLTTQVLRTAWRTIEAISVGERDR